MLKAMKMNEVGHLKTSLTSAMEMQSLEISLLVSRLPLDEDFLTVLLPLPLGTVIYILCHDMLKVCNLLFDFDYLEDYN